MAFDFDRSAPYETKYYSTDGMDLMSVRFAFPSSSPTQRFRKNQYHHQRLSPIMPRDEVGTYSACLIGGIPCTIISSEKNYPGKYGNPRYRTIVGACLLTGKRYKETYGDYALPLVTTEYGGVFGECPPLKNNWKTKHGMTLLPPDKSHFVMEAVYQSPSTRMTKLWTMPMMIRTESNPFLTTAVAFLRSQEKERFYYFLCALRQQGKLIMNANALSHIFTFVSGARTEDCGKLICFKDDEKE